MGGGVVQQILCPLESVVGRAGLLHRNGVEADQEGRIHTARVEQDTDNNALNSFYFLFRYRGGFFRGERIMGIFAILFGCDNVW